MRAFIERVFKSKKQKQKELLDEIITEAKEQAKEQATEAAVEAIIKEVKKEKHIDCECKECLKERRNNAKRIKETA